VLHVQVYAVACELAKRYIWLVPGLLTGGENRHHEKQRLRKGVVILVATPGRLLDHLESTTAFSVAHLQWLVLDEADRLLDLGFQKSLSRIVELIGARSAMSDVDRHAPSPVAIF
jgi:ATP-dependent RNA helicase DDX31/DBP7